MKAKKFLFAMDNIFLKVLFVSIVYPQMELMNFSGPEINLLAKFWKLENTSGVKSTGWKLTKLLSNL